MHSPFISKYKSMFEEQRRNLLYTQEILSPDFVIQKEDMLDETDWTSSELEQSMRMRLRNREALFLKKIDQALERIKEGTFGKCESCEEDIDPKRLEARPTSTECIHCKEESERQELLHIDGHRPKSVGRGLRFA
jgi:DnaK suppressor protein